ncbi:group 1 truncated hemoglobin [Glaciihabitans sp. UYNi722]|uniref:group I truncated hemoglobin n=1 Tax=Glaciihabitans sp. UYNi722 TaxID=3156344 RepID=UPI0033921DE4
MSLYDQLGGEKTISTAVSDFYNRVSAHVVTATWFEKTDAAVFQDHLRAYLAVALGGPELYSGRSMRNAHGRLHITGEAFDVVLGCFREALAESGVSAETISRVDARLGSLRAVVVTPDQA